VTLDEFMARAARDRGFGNPPPELPGIALEMAVAFARMAPCRKSKRGSVVFDPKAIQMANVVLGAGFNGQPPPWRCDGTCTAAGRCAKLCEHAEGRALEAALTWLASNQRFDQGERLRGLELVHIKVGDDGEPTHSGGPSCWQCSRRVVAQNIAAVWLYQHGTQQTPHGALVTPPSWVRWPAEDFHQETLRACKLLGPVEPTAEDLVRQALPVLEMLLSDADQHRINFDDEVRLVERMRRLVKS
jgi:hypothetical protein